MISKYIEIEPVAVCLIVFGAHLKVSFIMKMKILSSLSGHIGSTQPCWLLSLEMISISWAHSSIFFEHIFFLLLVLRVTYHSIIGVEIIVVLDLGMSTFLENVIWLNLTYYWQSSKCLCIIRLTLNIYKVLFRWSELCKLALWNLKGSRFVDTMSNNICVRLDILYEFSHFWKHHH